MPNTTVAEDTKKLIEDEENTAIGVAWGMYGAVGALVWGTTGCGVCGILWPLYTIGKLTSN